MEFRILGSLEVRNANEDPVPLSGARQRALLAILLLRANERVSVEQLADDLWSGKQPQTALNALQVHVSHLRKLFAAKTPDTQPVLVTDPGGYRLEIEPDALDAKRFEALVAESRHALTCSDYEKASTTLADALALWRGPALADFREAPFAQGEIARLEELRLVALEDRVDADLALGRHAELIPELESLVAARPLRERLRGQLMLALYRSGRQADALEEYERARRQLVGELGLEPSVALKALQAGILRQEPSLDRIGGNGLAWPVTRTERRTVTAICATFARAGDGSDPELSARTGSSPIDEAVGISEHHGGLAFEVAGDRVLAVFGLPRANEDDALRALRSAVELRGALETGNELEVGIGVDTGSVLAQPSAPNRPGMVGDVLADVARLGFAARPGEILLGETTCLLAGHALRLGTARRLRGGKTIRPLLDMSSGARAVPLRDTEPLVDREQELNELLFAFDRTLGAGGPHLVTILGPAGIGKSRLATEFRLRIAADASVYVGRCLPYGEGMTFWPLAEVVEQAVGERAPGAMAKRLAGETDARTIAERIAGVLGAGGGSAGTEETFWAVRRFFEGLARKRPVVVLFDDLHWAEPTFLDLIEHVADVPRNVPLLLVCLARPELLDRRPTWGQDRANASSLLLEPLSEKESELLVGQLVEEKPLTAENRSRIVEAAGGNPLFLEELVRMTVERDEPAGKLSRVPPTIQAVLAARLDQLEPAERTVLEAASIVGKEFWLDAVIELAGQVPGVSEHVEALVRKDLVQADTRPIPGEGAFRFRHLLIRDAAYDAIPKSRRAELHQRFGQWLERTAGDRLPELEEIVGFHLEQAFRYRSELVAVDKSTLQLAARAARHLAAAARRAYAREDNPAEVTLLTRAVELLPSGDRRRRELLADLADALRELGDFQRAGAVLDDVEALASAAGDRALAANARVIRLRLTMQTKPDFDVDEVSGEIKRAIGVLEERGVDRWLAKAWEVRAWLPFLRCESSEAEEALARVVEHARRTGDGRQEARAVSLLLGTSVFGPLRVPDGIRRCEEILRRHADSRRITASASRALASLKSMRGDFETARALIARDKALTEELGRPLGAGRAAVPYGFLELLADDAVAAEAELRKGYRVLADVGEKNVLCNVAALLAEALYRQGKIKEAFRLTDVAKRAAAPADLFAQVYWRTPRAKVLAKQGRLDEAEQLVQEALAFAYRTDSLNTRGDARMDAAEVFRLDERPLEAAAQMRKAIHAYDRKGNRTASRKARCLLAELAEPAHARA